jgi:hypothetical protein
MRAVLLTCRTMICVEVEVDGDKLAIRAASVGAHGWFGEASGLLNDGALLRDLLCEDDFGIVGELRDSLQKATTNPTTASWLSKMEFDVGICRDKNAIHPGGALHRAAPATYVQAKVQVASYGVSNVEHELSRPVAGSRHSSAPKGRAVLIFRQVLLQDDGFCEVTDSV